MPLSPYEFLDYRVYLRAVIAAKRAASPAFSLEMLGRKTGCLTKSHLSLILSGKRNLTRARADALGKALGLTETELCYFRPLVAFTDAKASADRETYLSILVAESQRRKGATLPLMAYRVLESWHGLVIRELARLPGFDADAVPQRLKGRLSASEARRAVTALVETGLLAPAPGGGLVASDETLRTSDEISSLAIRRYHRSVLALAADVLDTDPVSDREFGSITLLLRPSDKPKLKELIKTFREQALALAAPADDPDARVSQLNLQMYDVSK